MDNREEFGHALHFVNNDVGLAWRSSNQFAQVLGTGGIAPLLSRREQIDPDGVRVSAPQPGALSGPPSGSLLRTGLDRLT